MAITKEWILRGQPAPRHDEMLSNFAIFGPMRIASNVV